MSTQSGIAIRNPDGSYDWIYIHCDGYPAGVGRILLDYYRTRDRVAKLIALGDMSALGPIPYAPSEAWWDTFDPKDAPLDSWRWELDWSMRHLYCDACGGDPAEHVADYRTLRRRFMASDREWLYVFDDEPAVRVLRILHARVM